MKHVGWILVVVILVVFWRRCPTMSRLPPVTRPTPSSLLNPPSVPRPMSFYHQDSFDWNKPKTPQMRTQGVHEMKEKQKAFNRGMAYRHAAINATIQGIATRHGAVVVMLVNYVQLDMLLNFLCACDAHGLPCRDMVFVFTLDAEAQAVLEAQKMAH